MNENHNLCSETKNIYKIKHLLYLKNIIKLIINYIQSLDMQKLIKMISWYFYDC